MGTPLPPKQAQPPSQFSAHVRRGQMAGWIKMPLGIEVCLGAGNFVFDGNPAPPPNKGEQPLQFSAHVYYGQMAIWIKMPLGTEVGLGPGDIELHGDPAPTPPNPKRGTTRRPSNFWPMSVVAIGLCGLRCHLVWR